MLTGMDYPDFLFSLKDIRGKPGPLEWAGIGNSNSAATNWHQNQYTRTYFSSINGELGKIGDNIKKFWDVKDISGKVGKKMMNL